MRAALGWMLLVTMQAGCVPDSVPWCDDGDLQPTTRIIRDDESALTCRDAPELCDLGVTSDIRREDLATAFDIVFIPDGFAADELAEFDEIVQTWTTELREDATSIVGRAPNAFNFHSVNLVRVGGENPESVLGSCRADGPTPWTDNARVALAAGNAPDVDVAVVVFNARLATANASIRSRTNLVGVVRTNPFFDAAVLDHELAHALVGLGDEYGAGGADDCFTDTFPNMSVEGEHFGEVGLSRYPNLSTDDSGALWAGVVDGAEVGGDGFSDCVWHPTSSCRMNDFRDVYCPVCSDQIDRVIADHVDGIDEGPAKCSVQLQKTLLDDGNWELSATGRGYSQDGVSMLVTFLDGDEETIDRVGHGTFDYFWQGTLAVTVNPGDYTLLWHCSDAVGREDWIFGEVPFRL